MKRLQSESGLNYLTDTLTSAWDAMRANFGVSQKSSAPHGWLTRHRWPLISLFSYLRAFSQILPLLPLYFHFQFQSGRSSPFLPLLLCFSPYSRPTARPFRAPGRRSTKRPYRCRRNNQLPIIRVCGGPWIFTKICKFQEEKEEICTEATDRGCECL